MCIFACFILYAFFFILPASFDIIIQVHEPPKGAFFCFVLFSICLIFILFCVWSILCILWFLNPRTAERFFLHERRGGMQSCIRPLTSVPDVIRTWFRCLPLCFRGQRFQRCWCRLSPTHRSAGNQDGGQEIGSEWRTRRPCQKSADKFGISTESDLHC